MQQDLQTVSRNRLAEQITGSLSRTQKMPSYSWGILAFRCQIGSILAENPVRSAKKGYARKGRYTFPAVQAKLEERYRGLFNSGGERGRRGEKEDAALSSLAGAWRERPRPNRPAGSTG